MNRFRPWQAALLVVAVIAAVVAFQTFAETGRRIDHARVSPGADGTVQIDLAGLTAGQVRFYRFLNTSNQEVDFFAGRDQGGTVQVGFDASEVCMKKRRGFRHEGEWMVCNFCDKAFHLREVNADGGGCAPVALKHRVDGNRVVIAESDVLAGWRLFH